MTRWGAVARKEIAGLQGSLLGLAISVSLAMCALHLYLHLAVHATTSLLIAWMFVFFFVPLCGLVLEQRLIVDEYRGRTHLFMEALPIGRAEMAATKYLLGLACLLSLAWACLGVEIAIVRLAEAMSFKFAAIMAARAGIYVFFVWSFLFAMAFMGRFKVPVYLGFIITAFTIDTMTDLNIGRFGPLVVMDMETFPTERHAFPLKAIAETAGLGAAMLLVGMLVATVREGSLAEAQSKRMSQPEKAMIACLFVFVLVGITIFDEKKEKKPLEFVGSDVLRAPQEDIQILYAIENMREPAEGLMKDVASMLRPIRGALGLASLPPVRLAYNASLRPQVFESDPPKKEEAVLVRANFQPNPNWVMDDFEAFLLREILASSTEGRSLFEPKEWVHVGFSRWWVERGVPDRPKLEEKDRELILRALWTTQEDPLRMDRLEHWDRYEETHGQPLAEAVAYSGMRALEERAGPEAVMSLARSILGRLPHRDIRETLYEWRHPMAEVFESSTGEAWPDFVTAWDQWLDGLREDPSFSEALDGIPRLKAQLAVVPSAMGPSSIRYSFEFSFPPARETLCALLHRRLPPFDDVILENTVLREEHLWPYGAQRESFELKGRYSPGQRAFLALECDSEVLGCPIRAGSRRITVPR